MIRLTLQDEYATAEDLLLALEHIVGLIQGGCTSGYYPSWDMTGEEVTLDCAADGDEACTILPGEQECRRCGA